jgi:hypothetical protein
VGVQRLIPISELRRWNLWYRTGYHDLEDLLWFSSVLWERQNIFFELGRGCFLRSPSLFIFLDHLYSWQSFVNAMMNLWILDKAGDFLTSWASVTCSRGTLFHISHMTVFNGCYGRAIAQAVSRRASHRGGPVSIPGQVMWDLWWTKWHWGRFGFPCQFPFHQLLHTHRHLSSGARTIGQILADVPSRLSLTPPQESKKKKKGC